MDIIFINHTKSQCGVYEIGRRIYELIDKKLINITYFETNPDDVNEYTKIVEENKPKYIIYNYYPATLRYVNKNLFQKYNNIKHIGIIHDLLSPQMIELYNTTFDCWIIHDDTNQIVSKNKFTTVRPIRRYNKKISENNLLSIGSHGFGVSPWKMFDYIIKTIHEEFDEVQINMNITRADFGGQDDTDKFESWKNLISKHNVKLNITNTYFNSEIEVIDFLSKNDLNVYFYNAPNEYVGVGGSADLAVSSQSSLLVNKTHMYRHFHNHLGFYEQTKSLKTFLNNKDKVREIYEIWSPERITNDYKKMIESL